MKTNFRSMLILSAFFVAYTGHVIIVSAQPTAAADAKKSDVDLRTQVATLTAKFAQEKLEKTEAAAELQARIDLLSKIKTPSSAQEEEILVKQAALAPLNTRIAKLTELIASLSDAAQGIDACRAAGPKALENATAWKLKLEAKLTALDPVALGKQHAEKMLALNAIRDEKNPSSESLRAKTEEVESLLNNAELIALSADVSKWLSNKVKVNEQGVAPANLAAQKRMLALTFATKPGLIDDLAKLSMSGRSKIADVQADHKFKSDILNAYNGLSQLPVSDTSGKGVYPLHSQASDFLTRDARTMFGKSLRIESIVNSAKSSSLEIAVSMSIDKLAAVRVAASGKKFKSPAAQLEATYAEAAKITKSLSALRTKADTTIKEIAILKSENSTYEAQRSLRLTAAHAEATQAFAKVEEAARLSRLADALEKNADICSAAEAAAVSALATVNDPAREQASIEKAGAEIDSAETAIRRVKAIGSANHDLLTEKKEEAKEE